MDGGSVRLVQYYIYNGGPRGLKRRQGSGYCMEQTDGEGGGGGGGQKEPPSVHTQMQFWVETRRVPK